MLGTFLKCYLHSVHLGFHTLFPSDITKYPNVLNSFFPSYTNSIIPSVRCCGVFWHESLFTNWLPIALDSITFHVIIDSFLLVFAPLCYKEIKISSKRHSFPVFNICPIFQNCHCLHNSHLLCCFLSFVSADIVTAGIMNTSWTWSHSFSTGEQTLRTLFCCFLCFHFSLLFSICS